MRRTSDEWLAYFRANEARPSPAIEPSIGAIDEALRAPLARSLGRFWLGETGEGRIAHEARASGDPALDDALCECIALYVREEGRHARELAAMLDALGAPRPARHWSEAIFRRGRRALGVRTKMMTIAAAEIVGAAYYGAIARHVPALAAATTAIQRDERMHLALQRDYFARVAACESGAHVAALAALFAVIATCALATVVVDHRSLFRALGVSRARFVAACVREASEAIEEGGTQRTEGFRQRGTSVRHRRSASGNVGSASGMAD